MKLNHRPRKKWGICRIFVGFNATFVSSNPANDWGALGCLKGPRSHPTPFSMDRFACNNENPISLSSQVSGNHFYYPKCFLWKDRKNHAKHSNHGVVPNWPGRSNASFPRWAGKFCRTSTVAIREFFGETGAHWTRRNNPYMAEENEKEPWSSVQWNKVGTRWKMGTLEDKKNCVLGFQTLCEVKFGPPKTYPQPPNLRRYLED